MHQKRFGAYISVVHGLYSAGYSTPPLRDSVCKGDF